MARPTKLTPALCEAVCTHIRVGAGVEVAAEAEGLHPSTAWDWLKRGKDAESEGADKNPKSVRREAPYASFAESVARARADFELSALRRLGNLDTSEIDPKVAAALTKSLTWLLERTRRERYGSHITIKVEEAKTYLLDVVERVCERMGQAAVLEEILDELERGGEGAEGSPTSEREHIH